MNIAEIFDRMIAFNQVSEQIKENNKKSDQEVKNFKKTARILTKGWLQNRKKAVQESITNIELMILEQFGLFCELLIYSDKDSLLELKNYLENLNDELQNISIKIKTSEKNDAVLHEMQFKSEHNPARHGSEIFDIMSPAFLSVPDLFDTDSDLDWIEQLCTGFSFIFLNQVRDIDIAEDLFNFIDNIVKSLDVVLMRDCLEEQHQSEHSEMKADLLNFIRHVSIDEIWQIVEMKPKGKIVKKVRDDIIGMYPNHINRLYDEYWLDYWFLEKYLAITDAISQGDYANLGDKFANIVATIDQYDIPQETKRFMLLLSEELAEPFSLEAVYDIVKKRELAMQFTDDFISMIGNHLYGNFGSRRIVIEKIIPDENAIVNRALPQSEPKDPNRKRRNRAISIKPNCKNIPLTQADEQHIDIDGIIFLPQLNPRTPMETEKEKIIRLIRDEKIKPRIFRDKYPTQNILADFVEQTLEFVTGNLGIKMNLSSTSRLFVRNILNPTRVFYGYEDGYKNFHPAGPRCRNYYIVHCVMELQGKKYIVFDIEKTKDEQK